MPLKSDLSSLEIYGIAIKSEIDAAQGYKKMANLVKNPTLKEKLNFLIGEELKHKRLLTNLYHREFPQIKLVLPKKGLVPKIASAIKRDTPMMKLWELAMDAEKKSENFLEKPEPNQKIRLAEGSYFIYPEWSVPIIIS